MLQLLLARRQRGMGQRLAVCPGAPLQTAAFSPGACAVPVSALQLPIRRQQRRNVSALLLTAAQQEALWEQVVGDMLVQQVDYAVTTRPLLNSRTMAARIATVTASEKQMQLRMRVALSATIRALSASFRASMQPRALRRRTRGYETVAGRCGRRMTTELCRL